MPCPTLPQARRPPHSNELSAPGTYDDINTGKVTTVISCVVVLEEEALLPQCDVHVQQHGNKDWPAPLGLSSIRLSAAEGLHPQPCCRSSRGLPCPNRAVLHYIKWFAPSDQKHGTLYNLQHCMQRSTPGVTRSTGLVTEPCN
jgi:hypothetical protein